MEIIKGDVFDSFLYPSSMVVHGCNAKGVMGSGVARVVRNNFPAAYYEYVRHHEEHGLKLGEVINVEVLPRRFIANAITQESFGSDGRRYVSYHAIRVAFGIIRKFAIDNNIETINYPLIGAGLGGGNWDEIAPIINEQLDGLNHFLWIPE